jgi:demethylmenaquinone methyltransferase/2-methoxy-6-polyprenyl-1,4-benzoquinol methylase
MCNGDKQPFSGSERVPEQAEAYVGPLHDMFAAIPGRYDLLNRVLTWGFDERWRRRTARECLRYARGPVMDLGCGTGDLTLHLARMAPSEAEIVGTDFAEPMLEVARAKATAAGLGRKVTFIHGDISKLPFRDGHFSVVAISFAFRNITYHNPLRDRYLAEVLRVLSEEGRFVIVETSQPSNPLFRAAFHTYLRWVVSGLGSLLSGHRGAYRYLAESARRFYTPGEVGSFLKNAGFREVHTSPLMGGIAAIHVAIR